jgi:hypothetical protein
LGTQLTQSVTNPFYPYVTAPGSSLTQPTVVRGQLLRPYPQYTGVQFAGQGVANSTYESLQVKAEERFSSGGSLLVAYTHAKFIANTDTITSWLESGGTGAIQNWNNLRGEKSLASFDTPDCLVVSYVLDVPVGRGRKFMSTANALVQTAIGGWGIQGVTTIQTGFPLHFGTNVNQINSQGGGSRPNVVGGCQKDISGSVQSRLNRSISTSTSRALPRLRPSPSAMRDAPIRISARPASPIGISRSLKTSPSRHGIRLTFSSAPKYSTCSTVRSSAIQTRLKETPLSAKLPAYRIYRAWFSSLCALSFNAGLTSDRPFG